VLSASGGRTSRREQARWLGGILRQNRTGLLLALGLTLLSTSLDVATLVLYYPILALLTGASVADGIGMRLVSRVWGVFGVSPGLLTILGLLVALLVFRSGCLYVLRVVIKHYELDFNLRLRREFLRRFAASTWEFIIRSKPGSLLNLFAEYTTSTSRALFSVVELMDDVISCLGFLAVAVYASPVLALFILAAAVIVGPILRRIYWGVKALIRRRIQLQNQLANKFLDYLGGFKTFKSMSLETFYLRALDRDLETFTANERRSYKLQVALNLLGQPLFALVGAGFLIVAHYGFSVGVETVVIFFVILTKTYARLNSLQISLGRLVQSAPAVQTLREFDREAAAAGERGDGQVLEGRIATVEFDRVGFTYPDGTPVFEGVSFTLRVERGLIVITGPSGIGKSTLLDLLSALLLPSSGIVRINGVDARDLDLRALRSRMGFVPQVPVLFDRTIKENISLREDDETDPARVEEAARLADAHEFIARLARGYDTLMGEDGASLSLGQNQRISMARALYQKPELLFFDEPTSALDAHSAREVMKVIERVAESYPVFLVSHSEEIQRKAQTLIVLDRAGVKVVERGPVGATR